MLLVMKVLLTGANGYIGKRLLPLLLEQGHTVVCAVRDAKRFPRDRPPYIHPAIIVHEMDLIDENLFAPVLADIDAAYYLVHSMSDNTEKFQQTELRSAQNFTELLDRTTARQIVYLGGITNEEQLSPHLKSRKQVDERLRTSRVPVTSIKAGIIVGSGSSSFEIIRDLVEKLPLMIAPKWLKTRTQPVAISNVLECLSGVLLNAEAFGGSYDIGGPDVMTYKEMLLEFAEVRGLRRWIISVPVLTPKLSSYWLYFVTSTSFRLASNLVDSMTVEVVARDTRLMDMIGVDPIPYKRAVELAFQEIGQNSVISSWTDSLSSSYGDNSLLEHIDVPENGCYFDKKQKKITSSVDRVVRNIWSIGGRRGWYYANWLWWIRGLMDKFVGGVGLRRGRTSPNMIDAGDTLDFWRVLVADRAEKRLLLYAEMKLPGEAWLEFRVVEEDDGPYLKQTATFRPRGVLGRLYWYSVFPFHHFVFNGMADSIIASEPV